MNSIVQYYEEILHFFALFVVLTICLIFPYCRMSPNVRRPLIFPVTKSEDFFFDKFEYVIQV
jgi:hypothetical protein